MKIIKELLYYYVLSEMNGLLSVYLRHRMAEQLSQVTECSVCLCMKKVLKENAKETGRQENEKTVVGNELNGK